MLSISKSSRSLSESLLSELSRVLSFLALDLAILAITSNVY